MGVHVPLTKILNGEGRVVQLCWVNYQCRGVLQFGYSLERAYCAGGVVWTFLLSSILLLDLLLDIVELCKLFLAWLLSLIGLY